MTLIWKDIGVKIMTTLNTNESLKKMVTSLDCLPCIVRQTVSIIRKITEDPKQQTLLLKSILQQFGSLDLNQPPPKVTQLIHRLIQEKTGVGDLYQDEKRQQNAMALAWLPEMSGRIKAAEDPFQLALRLSIAGNVIDCGVSDEISEADVVAALEKALQEPIHGDLEALRSALHSARRVLYLADNAGEIVFDRLLIEQIGCDKVTLVVRGEEILNDVTRSDVQSVGLDQMVEVIDNGTGIPGTLLEDCSAAFRQRFAEAELIISKGQGNYETLSGVPANIFFLFKAKCSVIAKRAGVPIGTHVILHS
ncbi:MAG: ARMT1-like domain-containing protein [Lentisphaeria bacterium]